MARRRRLFARGLLILALTLALIAVVVRMARKAEPIHRFADLDKAWGAREDRTPIAGG